MKHHNKKAQIMGVPFQIIFSLILIAAFIYAAMIGIRYFIGTSNHAKINLFIGELSGDVENAWLATEISQEYEFSLPSGIKYVCFSEPNTLTKAMLNSSECPEFEMYVSNFKDKNMNMFFCPPEEAWKVDAPINALISCKGKNCLQFNKNPYCIKNTGKIKIKLEKDLENEKIKLS